MAEQFTTVSGNIPYPEAFERVWAKRPRRQGTNTKYPAFQAWRKATKTTDPAIIEAALDKYKEDFKDQLGTPFIPMFSTWLNQRRWEDSFDKVPEKNGSKVDWDWVCKMWLKTHKWYHRSPSPGFSGVECPKETLARYGIET